MKRKPFIFGAFLAALIFVCAAGYTPMMESLYCTDDGAEVVLGPQNYANRALWISAKPSIQFFVNGTTIDTGGTKLMVIDGSGFVGIGGYPGGPLIQFNNNGSASFAGGLITLALDGSASLGSGGLSISSAGAISSGASISAVGSLAGSDLTIGASMANINPDGSGNFLSLAVGGGTTINFTRRVSATLDFPSTLTLASSDLTIAVLGAVAGDCVMLGIPNGSANAKTCYTSWISANGTATVRFNNYSSASVDPPSGTFTVTVIH